MNVSLFLGCLCLSVSCQALLGYLVLNTLVDLKLPCPTVLERIWKPECSRPFMLCLTTLLPPSRRVHLHLHLCRSALSGHKHGFTVGFSR